MATTSFKGGECAGKSYLECTMLMPPEEWCRNICHTDKCVGHNLNSIQKGTTWELKSEDGPLNCSYNELTSYFGGPERRQCHVCCPPPRYIPKDAQSNKTSAINRLDGHAQQVPVQQVSASSSFASMETGAFAGVGVGMAVAVLWLRAFGGKRRPALKARRSSPTAAV